MSNDQLPQASSPTSSTPNAAPSTLNSQSPTPHSGAVMTPETEMLPEEVRSVEEISLKKTGTGVSEPHDSINVRASHYISSCLVSHPIPSHLMLLIIEIHAVEKELHPCHCGLCRHSRTPD